MSPFQKVVLPRAETEARLWHSMQLDKQSPLLSESQKKTEDLSFSTLQP